MAEKKSFDQELNEKGVSVQGILSGDVDLSRHKNGADINLAFANYFQGNPETFQQLMNQAAASADAVAKKTKVNQPIDDFLGGRKQAVKAEVRESNLRALDDIFRGIRKPTVSQQTDATLAAAMTPYPKSKMGTPLYNNAAEAEKLIGYYASQAKHKQAARRDVDLSVVDDVMNSRMLPGFNGDGTVRFQGGSIWGQVDAGINGSVYSNFSTSGQGTIEKFNEFMQRVNNPRSRGRGFLALDIETFGSMGKELSNDEWFHISEIAATHFDYDKKQKGLRNKETFSWFAKPADTLQAEMLTQIGQLRDNPAAFQTLSEAKQRTLVDLMLYSDAQIESNTGFNFKPAGFERINDVNGLNIIHSNIKEMDGLVTPTGINHQTIIQNFGEFAQHMERGLENMNRHGEVLDTVMNRYNGLMEKHKSKYVVTFNGNNFDIPGLNRFGGVTPKRHLDWLSVGRVASGDPFEFQNFLGRDPNLKYEQGPETLYEYRRSLGLSTEGAHIATVDVGDDGLGGVVLRSSEKIQERIAAGATDLSQDGTRTRSTGLSYSDTPLQKGQLLFSTGGVFNNGSYQDFQGEYVDGKLVPTGNNGSVLNAESFYQFNGVRKVNGTDRYIMELYNTDNDTASYIIREGENARHELAEFVHHNLRTADEMMGLGTEAVTGARQNDLARRRFDGLFGLQQGRTKGYEAAKRMFENVDVFRQNFSGDIESLTDADRASLTGQMNFDSLFDPQSKQFRFNPSEADQFWSMLPRLNSERDAFGVAMEKIETALPFDPKKPTWQQRDDNIARSLMLKRFHGELNNAAGGGQVETRPALPYESRVLSYTDRVSGGERTLNLHNPNIAANQIKQYIYADHGRYADNKPMQQRVAGERYLTLLTSLQESGYMHQQELQALTNEFNQNPGASPSALADKLARDLAQNEQILEQIQRDTITEKSMRASDAVRNLSETEILTAADNGVRYGMSVRGGKAMMPVAGGNRYAPAFMTEGLEQIFAELDKTNEVTRLTPNNRKAVMDILDTFMNRGDLSHGVGYALTANSDNSSIFLNLFHETNTTAVLNSLSSGEASDRAIRVAIPLIGENGTMRHGNVVVDANSTVIRDANSPTGFRKVSSVERMADSFKGVAHKILRGIHEPEYFDKAQQTASNQTTRSIQELSGSKRNAAIDANDSYLFKNNLADVGKQSHIDLAPAILHELNENNQLHLPGPDHKYDAHVNPSALDKNGNLKTYLDYNEDLTVSGKELVSRNMASWAARNEEVLGGPVDLSFVKEDKAWHTAAAVSGRRMIPFGEFGPHTRPNIVQVASAYPITPEMQQRMLDGTEGGPYVSFDTMLTTPEAEAARATLNTPDRSHMNVKLAIMSDSDLQDRLRSMHGTEAGRGILERSGLLNEDGSLAHERLPTLYEQQVVAHQSLIENMQMERTKNLDIDIEKSLAVAGDLIDENTGRYRIGATVERGQVIGLDEYGKQVRFENANVGEIVMDDGRVSIKYQEQVHKVINDIEKGTFSAGSGFSSELLDAVTGIEGTGAIIHPDFEKHGDFHHPLRGHLNRIAEEMKGMDGTEFEEKKSFLENFFRKEGSDVLGLRVVKTAEDIRIEESIGRAGFSEVTPNDLDQLLKGFGLSELQEMGDNPYGIDPNRKTLGLIQAMSWSDVPDFSRATNQEGNVTYGFREIRMLERQGLSETADFIKSFAMQEAKNRTGSPGAGGISDFNRGVGIMNAFKAFDGSVEPAPTDRIFTIDDFRPTPVVDDNRAAFSRTVLDTHYIQNEMGYNAALDKKQGFWLQLPEMEGYAPLSVDGKPVDRLLIPMENMEGKGNRVFRSDQQRINERIIERAREVEAAKQIGPNGMVDRSAVGYARERLQEEITNFHTQIRKDVTAGNGFLAENVFRTQLPKSAAGILKITSPEHSPEMGKSVMFISPADAAKMGVTDLLSGDTPYHGVILRNPTFHDQAMQVAEIRIGEHLKEGQQQVSAELADAIRGDSDGDYGRLAMLDDGLTEEEGSRRAAIQAELAERLAAQDAENAARRGREYAMKPGEIVEDFSFNSLTDGNGAHAILPENGDVAAKEAYSKFGKQIVGMASNLNYRYTQMAEKYFDQSNPNEAQAFTAIRDFFEGPKGLEQRIISAKNDKGQVTLETRHGGLELIEALQRRDFRGALAIDQSETGLGSYFTENAGMDRAVTAMEMLEERIGKQGMSEEMMGFGLRGGVNANFSDEQILAAMTEQGRHRPDANPMLQMLSEMNGTPIDVDYLYDAETQAPVYGRPPAADLYQQPASSTSARQMLDVNEMTPNYTERGASRIGSAISDAMSTKTGRGLAIAGAVGLGALMLTNLSSGDTLTPEGRPHNDEMVQSSNPSMRGAGQTARVEMNGSGYNGLKVSVSGQAPGSYSNDQIGALANGALQSAGIPATVNIRSQDDTSTLNQQWVQQQFAELINQG